MDLLRDRIYTNNPFVRQFLVSWVGTLVASSLCLCPVTGFGMQSINCVMCR